VTFQSFIRQFSIFASSLILTATLSSAVVPVVSVTSPVSGSSDNSPVHYVASASSPQCAKGIAAMRIYTGPHISVYTVASDHLDAEIPLSPGNFNTVVEAWDNCGGVAKTSVNITVIAAGLRLSRFLYVADWGTSTVRGFKVDPSTGIPRATRQGSVASSGSYRLASDAGGYRLYATNSAPTPLGRVDAYFVNRRNGSLSAMPGSPFLLNTSPGPVTVHSSGRFVFIGTVSLEPGDGIQVLRVNADGSLTPVNSTPVPTKSTPDSIAVDRRGKYLYVVSSRGNSIDVFNFDTTSGALTPVPGSPYTVSTPGCVDASPSGISDLYGRFIYTSNEGASDISGYGIAGKTGTLTELVGSPFPDSGGCPNGEASPRGLTTEPTGRFLYVMNGNPPKISIYSINAGNGALTHVKDTPQISNIFVDGKIRTDPSGKFLYGSRATAASGDELLAFSIDPVSGDLTPLPGSPFPLGSDVVAFDLAVTP
jgi:6-phosphogluconolactonase (cycloisomerase 2 family)